MGEEEDIRQEAGRGNEENGGGKVWHNKEMLEIKQLLLIPFFLIVLGILLSLPSSILLSLLSPLFLFIRMSLLTGGNKRLLGSKILTFQCLRKFCNGRQSMAFEPNESNTCVIIITLINQEGCNRGISRCLFS